MLVNTFKCAGSKSLPASLAPFGVFGWFGQGQPLPQVAGAPGAQGSLNALLGGSCPALTSFVFEKL